ncbi:hypothetical protein MES4922_190154 [Mesorhizobium ventifaucium]|uniref:Uncharacterized protein n=1 Tax=Mesorhizobium ventifaucium TaxID=666020 RepID=A0ABM9DLP9_9HYPH|nr:hypothetical protein MES4922_190154 [Mesorhizobium ventifaucium]
MDSVDPDRAASASGIQAGAAAEVGSPARLRASLVAGSAKNLVARQSIFEKTSEGRQAA